MSIKQFINTKFDKQSIDHLNNNKNIKIDQNKDIKLNNNKSTILSKYVLLRVLKDIPVFVGYDLRNYKVNKGDIATIPTVNARALIKRKVAIEINQAVAQ